MSVSRFSHCLARHATPLLRHHQSRASCLHPANGHLGGHERRWCERSCFDARTWHQTDRRPMSTATSIPPAIEDLRKILRISDDVGKAIAMHKPVVALESTIYTHGAMTNDLALEDVVRRHGGIPAVIGILDGVPTVGLTPEEVSRMVQSGGAMKVSRRDIAYLVGMGMMGRKIHGGTTIASTMLLARLAGIRVFGTGGLGGVHRGGQDSMDISADLTELGRTRVAVISAGCKGFLDIPRTLEFLETQGTLVATFADGRPGKVDFPAFWARDSGTASPVTIHDEREAAAMILAQERLAIESGLLFANPIPEEYAIPKDSMEAIIGVAVREASEKGFTGSTNTPYVLKRIRELTREGSVRANEELVRANVARATKIAVELSSMLSAPSSLHHPVLSKPVVPARESQLSALLTPVDILVAGSVALDLSCDYAGETLAGSAPQISPQVHTSNPARIRQSIGGVGQNVALAAHRVSQDTKVRLCSMVGNDVAGVTVLSSLRTSGLDTSSVLQLGDDDRNCNRTAQYVAINDADKNLVLAMADMDIFARSSFPTHWPSAVADTRPQWLVVDANWSARDIRAWTQAGKRSSSRVAFEPVSAAKSTRLFSAAPDDVAPLGVFPRAEVDLATPNQLELAAMHAAARSHGHFDDDAWFRVIDAFGMRDATDRFNRLASPELRRAGVPVQMIQLLPYIPTIIVKLGAEGCLLATILPLDDARLRDRDAEAYILARSPPGHPDVGGVYMRLFPAAEKVDDVISVNGVGDTFLGVLMAGLALGGKVENLVDVAQRAAVMTLRSPESVSPDLGRLETDLKAAASLA